MSRGGPRHEAKPLVDVGLVFKCLEKHKDILADLGAYEHMCSSSGPNAKALHATRKLWTGLLDLEPSGLIHSQPLRQALLSLLAENPDINLGKHTGLVWANLKVERLNCLLAHVRKLGRDSKSLMPVAAKPTRDQYHELLVGLKKLKMPNKTELALVPVTAAEVELGKAPSAKSKAATSELGKASLQEKAHVLGKAPASAKAKLGKAKPSKDAGKLGKVGKEALGKGKRKLAPRISDVSLDSEGFPGMFSSPSKKARNASSSQVMCLRRASSRLHAAMGYGLEKPKPKTKAKPAKKPASCLGKGKSKPGKALADEPK